MIDTKTVEPSIGEIQGVIVTHLRTIPDERGCIYHGLRRSEVLYEIAEVYFKKLYIGVINGWHVHNSMTLNYVTVYGLTKLALVDLRMESASYGKLMEVFCGEGNHCRVEIPPGVANASQAVAAPFSIFANMPDREHDSTLKYMRIDPFNGFIKYEWFRKHY